MIRLLHDPALLLPLFAAPFIGSFIGVLIVRLPREQPVAFARSACPHCERRLAARDLVPLLSFLALRGRCRHCGATIAPFHLWVELAAIVVAIWATLGEADPTRLWIGCGLGWTLLTLGWIDCEWWLLPDALTLPLLAGGLVLTWMTDAVALLDHCVACITGYVCFEGLRLAYRRLRGQEGLGGGDSKLIAAAGAWLGLAPLPFVLLVAAAIGLLAALALAVSGRTMTSRSAIPFGPCLALAFWIAWLHAGVVAQMDERLWGLR